MILAAITVGFTFFGYIAWHWCVQYARQVTAYERFVDAYEDSVYCTDDDDDDDFHIGLL